VLFIIDVVDHLVVVVSVVVGSVVNVDIVVKINNLQKILLP